MSCVVLIDACSLTNRHTRDSFGLRVGELSGVVDTDSGVHIILRTA